MQITRWSQWLSGIRRRNASAKPDWQTPEEFQQRLAVELVHDAWEKVQRGAGNRGIPLDFHFETAPAHEGCYVLAGKVALFWCKDYEAFPINAQAQIWRPSSKALPENISEREGLDLLEAIGSCGAYLKNCHKSHHIICWSPLAGYWGTLSDSPRKARRLWNRVRCGYAASTPFCCEGSETTQFFGSTLPGMKKEVWAMTKAPGGKFVLTAETIRFDSDTTRRLHITNENGPVQYSEWDDPPIELPNLRAAVYRAAFHGFSGSTLVPLLILEDLEDELMLHDWVPPRLSYGEEVVLDGANCAVLTQSDNRASTRHSIWVDIETLRIRKIEVFGSLDAGHYESVLEIRNLSHE